MNKTIIQKIKLGALSLSAVALLAACANDDAELTDNPVVEDPVTEEPTDNTNETDEATEPEEPTNVMGSQDTSNGIYDVEFPVTLEQATELFAQTFGEDVNISSIELDEDIRGYEYDLSGWDGEQEYELSLDAHSGEIKKQDTETDNDRDDVINLDNIITPREAMEIAVNDTGIDFVEGWSLEEDDGIIVYEIDLQGIDDITLNAETGDIVDR